MIEKCILLKPMVLHVVMLAPLTLVGRTRKCINSQKFKSTCWMLNVRTVWMHPFKITGSYMENAYYSERSWTKWICWHLWVDFGVENVLQKIYVVENFNYYSCNEYRHLNRLLHFARVWMRFSFVWISYGTQSHTTNIHANCEWRLNG